MDAPDGLDGTGGMDEPDEPDGTDGGTGNLTSLFPADDPSARLPYFGTPTGRYPRTRILLGYHLRTLNCLTPERG